MKVLFVGRNYSQGLKESDPTSIVEVARSLGMELVSSLSEQPDLLICVDFVDQVIPVVRRASRIGITTVLIINEPAVVVPQHAQHKFLGLFDRVIRVGRPDERPVLKWPQTWREEQIEVIRERKAVIVNADKWSFVSGQLYWLRAAISAKSDDVAVYGHGWERNILVRLAHRAFELLRTLRSGVVPNLKGVRYLAAMPRNFMGKAGDKITTMSNYKVALVIENSRELMTEKLFDALFAGCIPIYVGPRTESFGIPESLIIRCEDTSLESLSKVLAKALQADHVAHSKAIRDFLEEPRTESWKSFTAISQILSEALRSRGNE